MTRGFVGAAQLLGCLGAQRDSSHEISRGEPGPPVHPVRAENKRPVRRSCWGADAASLVLAGASLPMRFPSPFIGTLWLLSCCLI